MGNGDFVLAAGSESPPEMDVLVENRLLNAALPRTELAREGETERGVSGGGLASSRSAPTVGDMPGNCLLVDVNPASEGFSSWLRR